MNLQPDPVVSSPSELSLDRLEQSTSHPSSSERRNHVEFVDDAGADLSDDDEALGGRNRCGQAHNESGASSPSDLCEQEETPSFPYLPKERAGVGGTEGGRWVAPQVGVSAP